MLMLPFAHRELTDKWSIWRTEWKDLLLLGACGMWIFGAFVYQGAKTIIEMTVSGFPSSIDTRVLILGLIAAVVAGFAAYQAYSFIQSELGAANAGIVLYLGPLYGALTGYLFLKEQPQLFHFVGATPTLPSVYFATKK
jgi:uncharacterized membrane-anchored protein